MSYLPAHRQLQLQQVTLLFMLFFFFFSQKKADILFTELILIIRAFEVFLT